MSSAPSLPEQALEVLEDYLSGRTTSQTTSKWALRAMVSGELDHLSKDDELTREVVHALFELHDDRGAWVASQEELEKYRDKLAAEVRARRSRQG